MSNLNIKNNKKGFSLLELVLAVAIFSFSSFALATMIIDSNISTRLSADRTDALLYAKEGVEAVRSIRDNDWNTWASTTDGNHGLLINTVDDSSTWTFSGTSDLINSKYTRTVNLATDPVVSTSKDVTVNIAWNLTSGRVASTTLLTIFSNWPDVINSGLVVPRGLVSYWSLDGNADDSVGTYNGTISNATLATGTKGVADTAYSFNGSNSYISGLPGFGRDDSYSYSLWFKGVNFSSGGGLLDLEYYQDGSNFVAFKNGVGADGTLNCWAYSYVDGNRQDITCGSASGITPGEWYNFVFVWEGGAHPTVISYLNGSPIGGGLTPVTLGFTWTASQMSSTNRIGDDCGYGWFSCGSWTDPLNGSMDNIRVYRRVLTQDDVTAIYNAEKP